MTILRLQWSKSRGVGNSWLSWQPLPERALHWTRRCLDIWIWGNTSSKQPFESLATSWLSWEKHFLICRWIGFTLVLQMWLPFLIMSRRGHSLYERKGFQMLVSLFFNLQMNNKSVCSWQVLTFLLTAMIINSGLESMGEEIQVHGRSWRWRVQTDALCWWSSNWEADYIEARRGMDRQARALCCAFRLMRHALPVSHFIFINIQTLISYPSSWAEQKIKPIATNLWCGGW